MSVILIQVVLPLMALAWLLLFPGKSLAGLILQAAATALLLVGVALVMPWWLLPWWLPWLYLLGWLAGLAVLSGRGSLPRAFWPRGRQWALLLVAGALTVPGGWLVVNGLAGRLPADVAVVDLDNPLGPGRYMVAHGGSTELINGHMKTLNTSVPRFADWRGQSRAVDLVGIDRLGRRADGWQPVDPARYAVFGRPVFAPCTGTVISTENSLPDMPVPVRDRDHMLGNHVLLQCGDAVVLLAHLREDSVVVSVGDVIPVGDPVGQIGNSGNTTEPHLHIHAQRAAAPGAAPISGDPLTIRIDGRFLVRNDRIAGQAP